MHLRYNTQILWGPSLATTALSGGTLKAELAYCLSWPNLQEEGEVWKVF